MASEEGTGLDPDAEAAESGGRGGGRGEDADPEARPQAGPHAGRGAGPGAGPQAGPDAVAGPHAGAGPGAGPDAGQDAGQDAGAQADEDADQHPHPDADQDAHQEAGAQADQVAGGLGGRGDGVGVGVSASPDASQDSQRRTSRGDDEEESQSSVSDRDRSCPDEDNEDVAEDVAEDAAEDATEDATEDAAQRTTKDVAEDAAEDGAEGTTKDSAEDASDDVAEDAVEDDAEDAEDVAEDVAEDAAEDVAEDAAEDVAGSSSDDEPYPAKKLRRGRCGGAATRRRGLRGRGPSKDVEIKKEVASEDESEEDEKDLGLRLGFGILQDLLCTNSTFLYYPESKKGMLDYHDVIEKPMWFEEIQRRFYNNEYTTIVDFVKDVRLLLLNEYRYFGPNEVRTKRALRIEQTLEYKLAGLPKEIKAQCSLTATHGIETNENDEDAPILRKTGDFSSHLLASVSGERAEREKKKKDTINEIRQLDKEGEGKDILKWETEVLLAPPFITQMRTLWELPLIGHLIQLTVQVLCIDQVPQYEVERMFLMPQASKTLAALMTSLVSSPTQRPKLQHLPPMPYSLWSRKLSQRVAVWYRMFQTRNQDWSKMFELCGIEKEFWSILGDWNQLEDYEFHELSFHQRVWLVKSLCDYQVHNHKTMQDALAEHTQQQQNCQLLGEDRHGRQYVHFPQFCSAPGLCKCVRVYRCVIPTETHKFPDASEDVPLVRTRRGSFLPTWFKGRGKGKGKNSRGKVTKKKNDINKRKFMSRLVYRMPNGMHIRGKKKRGLGRVSDGAPQPLPQESKLVALIPPSAKENVNDPPSDSDDKSISAIAEELAKRVSRQTRSRKNTSQGFYGEWSDSESASTPSPGSSITKKVCKAKRKSTAVSTNDENSSSNSLQSKPEGDKKASEGTSSKQSDELGNSEDEHASKSPNANEDDLSNDSGCEEEESRGDWTTSAPIEKTGDGGDSDADEDEKEDSISEKKEQGFFSMSDDLPWMPADEKSETKDKQKRPHFNPEGMLLGAEHFELVADSLQGVRDLLDSLCEEDENAGLLQRLRKSASSSRPICEEKLANKLEEIINEIGSLEVQMESNAQKLRWKLFKEWKEFQTKPDNVKDEAETYWLSVLESGLDASSSEVKVEVKKEKLESFTTNDPHEIKKQENQDQSYENVDDESQMEHDIRHSLRAKKPKVDTPQNVWLNSDSEDESSDEKQDDAWELPGRRRKKRTSAGRSRRKEIKSEDEEEKAVVKKIDKPLGVAKNFSFEPCGSDKEASQGTEGEKNSSSAESGPPKLNPKMLPNKLTLDKEGNMFITLGCGTRVHLRKDDEGRIVVPEGHDGLSMIRGKTLEQLVGSGKVVQNKNRKPKKPPQTSKTNAAAKQPYYPPKRSTTLFPAVAPGDIVQAKEWMPPVVKHNIPVKTQRKVQGVTSIQAKEWTPPMEKKLPLSTTPATGGNFTQYPVRTYGKPKNTTVSPKNAAVRQKNATTRQVNVSKVTLQSQAKKKSEPEDIVVLSDGSDDSIEVLTETEPKSSKTKVGPRIESVIGNANVNSFASKPLTKSVTMTPVVKKADAPKKPPWSPVITNTVSLEPVSSSSSSSGRVPPPGAPQVVITPAKNVPARRNLQQGGMFNPARQNESFVTVSPVPMRQAQPQFVPMNQMVSVNNSFQPVAQVVGMNNQYLVANNPYPPMGNPYLVNAAPTYHYVPVVAPPTSVPLPLPVSAFDVGLPPGLTGQIVLANGDNNQFSYAFKLDDGGLIFLTNEQVSKIRAANGGKLTTMVQFQTH